MLEKFTQVSVSKSDGARMLQNSLHFFLYSQRITITRFSFTVYLNNFEFLNPIVGCYRRRLKGSKSSVQV